MQLFRRLYAWMGSQVHSKYASAILGVFFFIEAFFLIPASPMLVLYCTHRRDRAFRYAFIAMICSVLGGLVGYSIGYALFANYGAQIMHNSTVNMIVSADNIAYLCGLYNANAWSALIIASFFPIPYKAATITAGFCQISLLPFVCGSIIARSLRFFLIAFVISVWGKKSKDFIDQYFTLLVGLALILIVIGIWIFV